VTLPFLPRLVCLALATFFLVYAATSLLVAACAPAAIRGVRTLTAARAAGLLLTLRLLPAGLALFTALGLCVPG
jgi:hypothetical protein